VLLAACNGKQDVEPLRLQRKEAMNNLALHLANIYIN
jgi:hypothetical protein